jgi:hypothetical protein
LLSLFALLCLSRQSDLLTTFIVQITLQMPSIKEVPTTFGTPPSPNASTIVEPPTPTPIPLQVEATFQSLWEESM